MKTLGKYFPNTPMLAAIVKISKIMEEEKFIQEMEASLSHKFAKKPEVLEGNMQALRLAMQEAAYSTLPDAHQFHYPIFPISNGAAPAFRYFQYTYPAAF